MAFFRDQGVEVIDDWPPYSPDLNSIEQIWVHLKRKVYESKPDIDCITNKAHQVAMLEEALPFAWKLIRREIVESLVDSMKERIEAIIATDGWYTCL
ncbi:hypothetical protein K470DRAFT_261135 [Piedraia hortae CBS 480.64]|uniref:Tc1-like transposase DDE domain-containing protein n=1 Tax=Piedraia hortae CBS 480.64 TaxID=1314780 RepID=A0A6A7BNX1_9PEZI|nr:hypothetical protein K470DRAFT_261135 [Piedraia hortae CBS 480.64]